MRTATTQGTNAFRFLDGGSDRLKQIIREAVVMDIVRGRSEDEIYRIRIDSMTRAAKDGGCDESNVEVIVAMTRSQIADTLAECRASGIHPEEK